MDLQLLKRPRPLPEIEGTTRGIHAQWCFKVFFFKKDRFPRFSIKGQARVQYASLVLAGNYPQRTMQFPLVSLGYIEAEGDILDVRGCNFKVLMFGVDNILTIRDWLRFLVIRQRVPHTLIGKSFEWQDQAIRDDKQLNIPKISLLNCFKFL